MERPPWAQVNYPEIGLQTHLLTLTTQCPKSQADAPKFWPKVDPEIAALMKN